MVRKLLLSLIVMSFALGMAGCIKQEELDKRDAEIKSLKENVETLTTEKEALMKENEGLKAVAAVKAAATKKRQSVGKKSGSRRR